MNDLFLSRPFKTRNADEYDLKNILNLFVSPIDGLSTPFDYENTIIKGRMGSGKTIYLRANLAYYLYNLVPNLKDDNAELILPILIRLNDFQHLSVAEDIYRSIIIKVVEELTSIYLILQDAQNLVNLHKGFSNLSHDLINSTKLSTSIKHLAKLGCDEYIERVTTDLGLSTSIKPKFFDLSAQWKKTNLVELKKKSNPGIKDIEDCYKNLLENREGKILILIDEAGSLDKCFFQENKTSSFFEILMNQFRTASFIRTKIAVYPNSYSDMLTETRYGDVIKLEDSITDERGYEKFRQKVYRIIENYINPHSEKTQKFKPTNIFDIKKGRSITGDCLEQIIYASNGNMRRLIQLLDLSMNTAYKEKNCAKKINKAHVFETLKEHAENAESLFTEPEKDFLNNIISVCKARGSYKFIFPNMSPILYKYTSKSQEYNIINIDQLGSGRKGTTYRFDYSYSVLKDIPTHYIHDSERINRERSLANGRWINRIAQISDELVEQAALPGKLEGNIEYIQKDAGFIKGDDENTYFFTKSNVIESDKNKSLILGKRVRFYPTNLDETKFAFNLEILS